MKYKITRLTFGQGPVSSVCARVLHATLFYIACLLLPSTGWVVMFDQRRRHFERERSTRQTAVVLSRKARGASSNATESTNPLLRLPTSQFRFRSSISGKMRFAMSVRCVRGRSASLHLCRRIDCPMTLAHRLREATKRRFSTACMMSGVPSISSRPGQHDQARTRKHNNKTTSLERPRAHRTAVALKNWLRHPLTNKGTRGKRAKEDNGRTRRCSAVYIHASCRLMCLLPTRRLAVESGSKLQHSRPPKHQDSQSSYHTSSATAKEARPLVQWRWRRRRRRCAARPWIQIRTHVIQTFRCLRCAMET